MTKQAIIAQIKKIYDEATDNVLPETNGEKIFDMPLVGFGDAEDALFSDFKRMEAIGPWYKTPAEWLEGAKTVVELFFPFSEVVKESNRQVKEGVSKNWLYARIEGQSFIVGFMQKLKEFFDANDVKAIVPQADSSFKAVVKGKGMAEYSDLPDTVFSSNWSERHAAFACGLGTFGLSKGLITRKGMAGRFGGIVIDASFEADKRAYTELYEYCNRCGACVKRCPVDAISLEKGKNHNICEDLLAKSKITYAPRYGCGLCQTKTPCESGIPKKI